VHKAIAAGITGLGVTIASTFAPSLGLSIHAQRIGFALGLGLMLLGALAYLRARREGHAMTENAGSDSSRMRQNVRIDGDRNVVVGRDNTAPINTGDIHMHAPQWQASKPVVTVSNQPAAQGEFVTQATFVLKTPHPVNLIAAVPIASVTAIDLNPMVSHTSHNARRFVVEGGGMAKSFPNAGSGTYQVDITTSGVQDITSEDIQIDVV
jgi:hypothetical protein